MPGKKVTTIGRVMALARMGRCLVNIRQTPMTPIPAAFLQNYPARTLWMGIKAGCYAEYVPKKARRKTKKR